jgi:uncharacterized protein YprB with RNaseH-like and TPR domain
LLTSTFVHVPQVGLAAEASLWKQGCHTWGHFLSEPARFSVGAAGRHTMEAFLEMSTLALEKEDHQFFAQRLGAKNNWRAWPSFQDKILYLDIETDGGQAGESITMIGLYDGREYTCLTRDEGLGAFPDILSQASYLVTFWGTGFDIPMLRKLFPRAEFDQIHLDLCYAFRQAGIRGGLKAIEKQLGISRVEEAEGLTGRDAITLWAQWERRGIESARDTLIAYNREDVVNMERLSEVVYGMLKSRLADCPV